MDKEKMWEAFEKTGTIEDYLKYKTLENMAGIVAENGGINETIQGERSSNQRDTI